MSRPKHTLAHCSWSLLGVDSNDTHVIYPADPRSLCIKKQKNPKLT